MEHNKNYKLITIIVTLKPEPILYGYQGFASEDFTHRLNVGNYKIDETIPPVHTVISEKKILVTYRLIKIE